MNYDGDMLSGYSGDTQVRKESYLVQSLKFITKRFRSSRKKSVFVSQEVPGNFQSLWTPSLQLSHCILGLNFWLTIEIKGHRIIAEWIQSPELEGQNPQMPREARWWRQTREECIAQQNPVGAQDNKEQVQLYTFSLLIIPHAVQYNSYYHSIYILFYFIYIL